jgi:hypothetical protein
MSDRDFTRSGLTTQRTAASRADSPGAARGQRTGAGR